MGNIWKSEVAPVPSDGSIDCPVVEKCEIHNGSLLGSSGQAVRPLQAGDPFAGISASSVNWMGGMKGHGGGAGCRVRVFTDGDFELTASLPGAELGAVVYAADDRTLSLSAVDANGRRHTPIGRYLGPGPNGGVLIRLRTLLN